MLLRATYVYFAPFSTIKRQTHCACVWTIFTHRGTLKQTTLMLLQSTCIFRYIYCNKQGQSPLRMRIDGFCRWWDTYIKPQSCCYGPQVYYASSAAINKDKSHCACVLTGYAAGGTHISNHNHAAKVHKYITLHLRQ